MYGLSADLDWFSSKEARKLVEIAQDEGIIKKEDGELEVLFDYKDVSISMGFRPSKDIFTTKKEKPLFQQMLEEIVTSNNMDKAELMSSVNEKQDKLNVGIETALIALTEERGMKFPNRARYIQGIQDKLLSE